MGNRKHATRVIADERQQMARGNMKAERVRKGMTLEDVSNAIGVHVNAISRWENDTAEPTASNLIALCHLYECSPEYLLGMVDERNAHAVAG